MRRGALADYFERVKFLFERLPEAEIKSALELLHQTSAAGNRIFVAGNGGSAALASHFATDLSVGTLRRTGKTIRAVSLADNQSILTATANDVSFEEVYVEQLRVQAQSNDVVVLISSSGKSPNIIRAAKYCRENKLDVVALIGFDGGDLRTLVSHPVFVNSPIGDYGPIEDVHAMICHMFTEYLREFV